MTPTSHLSAGRAATGALVLSSFSPPVDARASAAVSWPPTAADPSHSQGRAMHDDEHLSANHATEPSPSNSFGSAASVTPTFEPGAMMDLSSRGNSPRRFVVDHPLMSPLPLSSPPASSSMALWWPEPPVMMERDADVSTVAISAVVLASVAAGNEGSSAQLVFSNQLFASSSNSAESTNCGNLQAPPPSSLPLSPILQPLPLRTPPPASLASSHSMDDSPPPLESGAALSRPISLVRPCSLSPQVSPTNASMQAAALHTIHSAFRARVTQPPPAIDTDSMAASPKSEAPQSHCDHSHFSSQPQSYPSVRADAHAPRRRNSNNVDARASVEAPIVTALVPPRIQLPSSLRQLLGVDQLAHTTTTTNRRLSPASPRPTQTHAPGAAAAAVSRQQPSHQQRAAFSFSNGRSSSSPSASSTPYSPEVTHLKLESPAPPLHPHHKGGSLSSVASSSPGGNDGATSGTRADSRDGRPSPNLQLQEHRARLARVNRLRRKNYVRELEERVTEHEQFVQFLLEEAQADGSRVSMAAAQEIARMSQLPLVTKPARVAKPTRGARSSSNASAAQFSDAPQSIASISSSYNGER